MMAKVEYNTCDRCKQKISYHTRRGAKVKYPRVVHIIWRFCQWVDTNSMELCNDCAEGLHDYLYPNSKPEKVKDSNGH